MFGFTFTNLQKRLEVSIVASKLSLHTRVNSNTEGRLTKDVQEGIDRIVWRVDGAMKGIFCWN
jgi:hypothetical protein